MHCACSASGPQHVQPVDKVASPRLRGAALSQTYLGRISDFNSTAAFAFIPADCVHLR
jgi:hypothetical protein